MIEHFRVGEVGVIAFPVGDPGARHNGLEVEVTSALHQHRDGTWVYHIAADWIVPAAPGMAWCIEAEFLRKRKPPQTFDWQAYARDLAKKQLEPA